MSDNWVDQYMNNRNQNRNRDAELIELALAGSPALFQSISDRANLDLAKYHKRGGDKALVYAYRPSNQFIVTKREFPSVELTVSLNKLFLECVYKFKESHTDERRESLVQFRILSNDSGGVQVYKNGEAFIDESEISEAILLRVFDYVENAR